MNKATKALVWCIALLAVGEACLRVIEASPVRAQEDVPRFETDRPYILVLGTSRARRGLWPLRVERAWAQQTGRRPWNGIVWEKAATYIGFHKTYMQEIRPWAARAELPHSVLAVEICGASMNDSYMRDEEARYARVNTFLPDLRAGDWDGAAHELRVHAFRFTEVRGIIDDRFGSSDDPDDEVIEAEDADPDGDGEGTDQALLGHYLRRYRWGQGYKGFDPREGTIDDLKFEMIRRQYTETLLKDYARGGIQTEYLTKLVSAARDDGFRVVFFILPITAEHKEFWPAGGYESYVAAGEDLAADLGVPLVNFDRDFPMAPDEFRDTNHLKVEGAE
ncbi:MAG: hypothetical protein HKN20_01760, partial [Gemmatimonadetes bacterium]|nr:hypothetical protein [Gemmatimonadota bacterium]